VRAADGVSCISWATWASVGVCARCWKSRLRRISRTSRIVLGARVPDSESAYSASAAVPSAATISSSPVEPTSTPKIAASSRTPSSSEGRWTLTGGISRQPRPAPRACAAAQPVMLSATPRTRAGSAARAARWTGRRVVANPPVRVAVCISADRPAAHRLVQRPQLVTGEQHRRWTRQRCSEMHSAGEVGEAREVTR
jgi:hypothetical protein